MKAYLLALIALEAALGQYCFEFVGPVTTIDANLGPVTLRGRTKQIFESSNCPGIVGPLDATNLVADIVPGYPYSLSFEVTTCGAWYPLLSGAWIDYNGNYQFDDWESLGNFTAQTGLIVFNFTAVNNSNVKYGATRLRVQVQETAQNFIQPCDTFPYGGTKDFTVEIVEEIPGYCNSGPTSTIDTQLGQVTFRGDSKDIVETTECPGGTGPVNFTNLTADLTVGNSYEITYNVTTCSNVYPVVSSAWIDFNQNQVWDQWEQIFPFSKRMGMQAYSFKVPKSTPSEVVREGTTRLRLQVQEIGGDSIEPCTIFAFGGTKDFSIQIKPAVDGGWSNWGPCNASCDGGYQTRECNSPPPSQEGNYCVGSNVDTCNTGSCSGANGGKIAAGILVPLIVIGGIIAFLIYRKKKAAGDDVFHTDQSTEPTEPTGGQTSYQAAV